MTDQKDSFYSQFPDNSLFLAAKQAAEALSFIGKKVGESRVFEQYKAVEEAGRKAFEQMRAIEAAGQTVIEQYKAFEVSAQKAAVNLSAIEAKFQDNIRKLIEQDKLAFEFIRYAHAGIDKQIEESSKTNKRYADIMLELGWPPDDQLFVTEIKRIVLAYDKNGLEFVRKEITPFMLDKYNTDNLNRMLAQWEDSKWLKRRMPILKQALIAHFEGNYFISIPTWLTQIEGIIADGYGFCGAMGGAKYRRFIRELLSLKTPFSFDPAIHVFIIRNVLVKFEHGRKSGSFLSRHAILHGADTDYGSAANSLKCILLFNYIQNKFNYITLEKSSPHFKAVV